MRRRRPARRCRGGGNGRTDSTGGARNSAGSALSLPLFVAGLLSIPCVVLQSQLPLLAAQLVFSFICALGNNKRIRPFYFLLLIASVAFFHLLTPQGQVYFYVWRLPITAGALLVGGQKGMTVATLVFCSLATVRPSIWLPSKAGALLSAVLVYFDMLFQSRRTLRRQGLLADIDRLLYRLYETPIAAVGRSSGAVAPASHGAAAWVREVALAVGFLAGHAAALAVSYIVG